MVLSLLTLVIFFVTKTNSSKSILSKLANYKGIVKVIFTNKLVNVVIE